jgi:signal transduction histidine kinase
MKGERSKENIIQAEKVPFRLHPRVFAALGADLVTNDVVAIIELAKNSYDACATRVDVRFGANGKQDLWLEVEDDGIGMSRETIDDAWCVVATPYRNLHPFTQKGKRSRRTSGAKGLGRLSAARLGKRLEMLTKCADEPCWQVAVDWTSLSNAGDIGACYVERRRYPEPCPLKETGTRIRLLGLNAKWDEDKIHDLRDNLSRLVSPFSQIDDFHIYFTPVGEKDSPVEIEAPNFLSQPPYSIKGDLDKSGSLAWRYVYSPNKGAKRSEKYTLPWTAVREELKDDDSKESRRPRCGPFSFEVRAWDIGKEDIAEIADRFDLQRSNIRRSIRVFKGISLYRDGILVLPKSDTARDWLGLDLRRVSRVGTRLSTSQIVGYVEITADENRDIEDTSDRERLVNSPAVTEFQQLIKHIVELLETQREKDREAGEPEPPLQDLFSDLSPEKLITDVNDIVAEGGTAGDALPVVNEFGRKAEKARRQLQQRLIYYSRLATVGTIAQSLVHEVRNKTMIIGRFLASVKEYLTNGSGDGLLKRQLELANNAVESLTRLADTFAPLASRSFRRRRRDCVIEDIVRDCVEARSQYMERVQIEAKIPQSATRVAVDPGELFAIVLNLLDNSLYWVAQSTSGDKRVEFRVVKSADGSRIKVEIHDSGPGITSGDEEKIFWPGVTRKPGGIGMGLTVVSELVSEYGGKMRLLHPGRLGGASFVFDVPMAKA